MGFLDILKGAKSSVDLQAAHDAINIDALSAAIGEADAELKSALLDADDSTVAKIEKKLELAKREHDRGVVRRQALQERIADAERNEARQALEAEHRRVTQLADKMARSLKADYVKAAGSLVNLLQELRDAENEVEAINQKVGEAGDLGEGLPRIEPIELRTFQHDTFGGAPTIQSASLLWFKLPNGQSDKTVPTWPPIEGRLR